MSDPDNLRLRSHALLPCIAALASCALPPREIHLAPLFSLHRTAGGGREVEALAGILRWKTDDEGTEVAARPVFRRFRKGEERGVDFLFPLGLSRTGPDSDLLYFFPLGWWRRQPDSEGRQALDAGLFPILFGGRTGDGKGWFGLFPIYGSYRGFFTYDEFRWVLFPLWVETRKEGGWRTRNVLWPFFGWGERADGTSLRLWPLLGLVSRGRLRSGFALWPLVHWSREGDSKSSFLVAPLFGKARDGESRSTTVLWPFFGWRSNPRTGFQVVEAPWPLLRLVRRGKGGRLEAERVLPFYASTRTEDVTSRTFLWPLVWVRSERGEGYERSSLYALPFYVGTRLEREGGERERLVHLWPLFHAESAGGASSFRTPALLPLPRLRGLYENVESLVALYDRRARGARLSQRLFADLWREERDESERRWSIPILAACRTRADGDREWSFLAGLLRFRTGARGFSLLAPAFPGPGFE
ncbi:MAG TPA: hypothetical protein VFI25_18655 [Planctomycetota bacterium]|nr:hypothetical protein [Planctomycetota bacterium]